MIFCNSSRAFRRSALALAFGCVLTFYGFLNYWQGIEAPNSTNHALAIILLLPIAALSTLFRAISRDGHLSSLTYRLVLVLGFIGQFLYYYVLLAFTGWAATKLKNFLQHRDKVR